MKMKEAHSDISSGYESDVENLSSSTCAGGMTAVGPVRSRRRRDRTLFTPRDLSRLEGTFLVEKYPDVNLRMQLALELGVTEDRIQVWFQNRRSRNRKSDTSNSRKIQVITAQDHMVLSRGSPYYYPRSHHHQSSNCPPDFALASTVTHHSPQEHAGRMNLQDEGPLVRDGQLEDKAKGQEQSHSSFVPVRPWETPSTPTSASSRDFPSHHQGLCQRTLSSQQPQVYVSASIAPKTYPYTLSYQASPVSGCFVPNYCLPVTTYSGNSCGWMA